MNFIKQLSLIVLSIALASCASTATQTESAPQSNTKQPAYVKEAKSVSPTQLPSGMSARNMQNYYPIPPVSLGPTATPPLTPPGSQAAQNQALLAANGPAAPAPSNVINQSASSSSSLVLNLDYQKAWGKVGQALHSAKYQVLQQDRTIGAFYVLDTASSGGQLKTTTPIYQVHLSASGGSTSVTILNDKNQPADSAVAGRIIGAVRQHM